MKKGLSKVDFKGLSECFRVLSIEEQIEFWGRNGDCVLCCFSYVSGHSVDWYANNVSCWLGYDVYETGYLQNDHFAEVGSWGGLNVVPEPSIYPSQINNRIANGGIFMLTFDGGLVNHAVIVTTVDPLGNISWIDPSKQPGNPGYTGTHFNGTYNGLYSLK